MLAYPRIGRYGALCRFFTIRMTPLMRSYFQIGDCRGTTMLSLCKYDSRESRVTFGDLGMKHLDVVDGELAAVPVEERPAAGTIGQNLELIILKLRSPLARALVHWNLPQTATPMMLMLGKELLSGLWVRPECRSFCCHFHTRPCLTLLFHRSLLLTTFVATRRCRCLLRSVGVNVMPGRLLFVISGSWLGGSLVSALSFVASYNPLIWPLVFCRGSLFCF